LGSTFPSRIGDVTVKSVGFCHGEAMMVIREFHSGTDRPSTCEECLDASAEIVLEQFSMDGEQVVVCRRCAMVALSEHPKLLVSAVVALITTSHIAVEV
jgi:hypothetical protein